MATSTASINILVQMQDQFTKGFDNLSGTLKKNSDALKSFGTGMTGLAVAGAGLIGVFAKTAGSIEQMKTSLTSALGGDKSAAGEAFDTIAKFAKQTPYDMEQVLGSFIKLKNLGLDPSQEALTSYGNTASAMGKSLDQMVEAVADASTGEFERLKEFGIKSSKEGDRVKFTFQGITTEIGNSSEEITKYLMDIGNTKFGGAMDQQSQTFLGVMSSLEDTVKFTAVEIGNAMLPALKNLALFIDKAATGITTFLQNNPMMAQFIGYFLIFGTAVAAIIGPLAIFLGSISAIAAGFGVITTAMTTLGITFAAVFWWVAALGALVAVGVLIYKNWDTIKAKAVEVWGFLTTYLMGIWNGLVQAVVAVWTPIQDFFVTFFEGIRTTFVTVWEGIKTVLTTYIALMAGLILFGFEAMGIDLVGVFETIKTIVVGAWEGIKEKLVSAFDFIKNSFIAYLNFYKTIFELIWNGLATYFGFIWENIKGVFMGGMQFFQDAIAKYGVPIANGFATIWQAVAGVVNTGVDVLKSAVTGVLNWMIDKINKVISVLNTLIEKGANNLPGVNIKKIANIPKFAEGGIATKPTLGIFGEAGPEALVPLDKADGFGGGTVVNDFSGATFMGGPEIAKQIGDLIAKNTLFNVKR